MLILTCCYLFLYFFAVILCSPSMLWFSFPTLTPAMWLNRSDRLWVPGESLSLSPQSPFSLSLRSLWQTHSGTFRNAVLSVGRRSMVSSHSHTCIHTHQKLSSQAPRSTCHTRCMRRCTQVHAGPHINTSICKGINKHRRWLKSRTHNVPQAHIMSHTSLPLDTLLVPV